MRVIVVDSSVLINFCHVSRLGLLGAIIRFDFVVPSEVAEEITRPDQQSQLRGAFAAGHLTPVTTSSLAELVLVDELIRDNLGLGEAACLAIAINRGWGVACDERRRFLRIARGRIGRGRLVDTPGILIQAIREQLLGVEEADRIKSTLAQKRYYMPFESFADLVEDHRSGDN